MGFGDGSDTSLQTDNHTVFHTNTTSSLTFYRPDALPGTQPTVLKHWKQDLHNVSVKPKSVTVTIRSLTHCSE